MKNKIVHIVLLSVLFPFLLTAARIKDVATIEGVNSTQVIGYGLVSGLNNSGDNQMSTFTVQSVTNMLKRFGLSIPQTNPRIHNVAAVMITATIPAFAKKGTKVDIQVSSIGDANSLQGGVLLLSPVSLSDGTIIGMAQGALSVGGYDVGSLGSRTTKNSVTSGRIPNGLILEKDMDAQFFKNQQIKIILRDPDFTMSSGVAQVINNLPNMANTAVASDAGTIQVTFPATITKKDIVQKISEIENQTVTASPAARVVINERTGTVVVGSSVQLLPAVVAHGGLEITIQKQVFISPPAPFTMHAPTTAETAMIKTDEQINPATVLQVQGASVQDIATALNLLKVAPRDLIAIFQALKDVGSLQAELIIQ